MTEPRRQPHVPCPESTVWFLRAGDQRFLAGLLMIMVLLLAGSTAWYAWRCGGLTHIDRLPVNSFRFEVDLNTADWTEISALPTIGEKTARRIIDFRQQHGPFFSLQDVAQVHGIGPHTLQSIEPYVAPFPPAAPQSAGSILNRD